ncbi:MAG: DUF4436 family protein [Spirochaetes bacterium]|nr:DUF4436 family protein [Spirochaetota bacterium]
MKIVKIVLGLLLFGAAWAGTLLIHIGEGNDKSQDFMLENDVPKDYILVYMSPSSIDPTKDIVKFKLDFYPFGKYLDEKSGYLTSNLTLLVPDNDPKKQEIVIKAGQKTKSIEVDIDIDGELNAYPHDHYAAQIYATLTDVAGFNVPVVYRYKDKLSGLDSVPTIDDENQKHGYLVLNTTINRTLEVRMYSWFINIMIAMLALAVVGVTYLVVAQGRKVEFSQMTWIGATLFVFVSMRNSQPSVPTFGTLLDVAIFFWAEVLTALSLVVIAATWMKRKPA